MMENVQIVKVLEGVGFAMIYIQPMKIVKSVENMQGHVKHAAEPE